VNSDKQTLILAGETVPWTGVANSRALVANSRALVAAGAKDLQRLETRYPSTNRGSSFSAANEYARTQELPGFGNRRPIIDTYA
jgi:hypothetical protein